MAFGYATQVVCLSETGWLRKVVAAHDVGRAINPTTIEGQIEGAIAMGLGYALQEDFPLKRGVPTAKFGTLGLFRSTDMPEIKIQLIEKNPSTLAYGRQGDRRDCHDSDRTGGSQRLLSFRQNFPDAVAVGQYKIQRQLLKKIGKPSAHAAVIFDRIHIQE